MLSDILRDLHYNPTKPQTEISEISKKFALFSGFLTEVCPRYTVKVIQA